MFIIRAEGYAQSFDNVTYPKQEDANSRARFLIHAYKVNFYVCKIVDISFFRAPTVTKSEETKNAEAFKEAMNGIPDRDTSDLGVPDPTRNP